MSRSNSFTLNAILIAVVAIGLGVFMESVTWAAAPDDSLSEAIEDVRAVGLNGQGNAKAVAAMKILNAASIDKVPQILQGMDGANPVSSNWFRSAVVSIVGRGGELPREAIKDYFQDRDNAHLGRLLAFELLTDGDTELADQIIPTLIDDPSLPLRAKAVDSFIAKADSAGPQESLGLLGFALEHARDWEQVVKIANLMDDKGVAVDLRKQLGFLPSWKIVGSFDNKSEAGFDVAYGPEKSLADIQLDAEYKNLDGGTSKWQDFNSSDATGIVDLNEIIGTVKGATAYATASFESEEARPADIRIGCINAHKVWVNGELVMSNEIYHNGISPDKFIGKAQLKKGENAILVKVCQNEQTEPWAQQWRFQLRICDESGKAIQPVKRAGEEN